MCERPIMTEYGVETSCHKCEQCLYGDTKDWAGRNIAEAKTSTASFAITLTYGPELDENRMPIPGRTDHLRAALLVYSDVQKFLKYARDLGYKFGYFVTGEKGSEKGRSHWHIIMHFRGKVPAHELSRPKEGYIVRFSDRHKNDLGRLYQHEICKAWPHGFMVWASAEFTDVLYNCKYINKGQGDGELQIARPKMSKVPPLGAVYFRRVAERYVEQGMAPQALEYTFAEITYQDKKTGRDMPIKFRLRDRSAELFLEHYIASWSAQRAGQQRPASRLVDDFEAYGRIVSSAYLDSFNGMHTPTLADEEREQEQWWADIVHGNRPTIGKATLDEIMADKENLNGPPSQQEEERKHALSIYREWYRETYGVEPSTTADALEFWEEFNTFYWRDFAKRWRQGDT